MLARCWNQRAVTAREAVTDRGHWAASVLFRRGTKRLDRDGGGLGQFLGHDRVHVHRERDRGVPQDLRDDLGRLSGGQQHGDEDKGGLSFNRIDHGTKGTQATKRQMLDLAVRCQLLGQEKGRYKLPDPGCEFVLDLFS
jgi:hypothetical protein